jgi:hypothetical protein
MVKSRIVLNGSNLDLVLDTDNVMTVRGNFVISVFIPRNLTDMVYFITPKDPSITSVSVIGRDLGLIVKTEKTIAIYGDVDKINLVNDSGEVVIGYTMRD